MCSRILLGVSLTLAIFSNSVVAVDNTTNPDLIAKLITANSQLDRLALLPDDEAWHFDFTAQKFYTFAPGGVVNMNAATFPAAKGNKMTRESPKSGRTCSLLLSPTYTQPTNTSSSGNAQPRTLLDAPDALARASHQLRRRDTRQHNDVHVRGERGSTGHRSPDAGARDDFPTSEHAHDDEHRYVNLPSAHRKSGTTATHPSSQQEPGVAQPPATVAQVT